MQDGSSGYRLGSPTVYQIRIKGLLDSRWSDCFGGMTVSATDNGDTLLTGPVEDQAALHGLLKKVRDWGMPLISVTSDENRTWKTKGEEES